MKVFLIFSAALLALAFATSEEDQIVRDYLDRFKIRNGRNANFDKIKKNILKKVSEIKNQNEKYRKGEENFFAELNELSWKDDDEFIATSLGFIEGPPSNNSDNLPISRQARAVIPDYWNWADKGVVRPPQNQGSCGSCYAFAAIGAIESQICIKYGNCAKLSEQEAMECTNLCAGGWDDWVYNYSNSKTGCTSGSYSYYPARKSSCDSATYRARIQQTKATGWYNFHGLGAETIRQYLYSMGPMFVAFDVYENFYNYAGGIYDRISGRYLGGHAVLLTGYGTQNGVDYWILRNSWGSTWAERGYFRMRRGINLGRIETMRVSIPIPV